MSDQLEIGSEFAGYRIDSLLGQGGFSSVYLAEDLRPAIRRRVAVKVLAPGWPPIPRTRRFHRESLLAVQLDDHPNIVTVLDAGEHEGRFYIVQRYVEGQDLAMLLEESGRMDPARVADIVRQVASALDAAHAEGLVHRDVKPGNILLAKNRDRVYLADFGLTKRTASDDSLTGAGEFLGTFSYAAPEQLGNDPVDGQADQCALGCVLYECLTGDPPFTGDLQAVIAAHVAREPPAASENAELPKEIGAVIRRALAKEPKDRRDVRRVRRRGRRRPPAPRCHAPARVGGRSRGRRPRVPPRARPPTSDLSARRAPDGPSWPAALGRRRPRPPAPQVLHAPARAGATASGSGDAPSGSAATARRSSHPTARPDAAAGGPGDAPPGQGPPLLAGPPLRPAGFLLPPSGPGYRSCRSCWWVSPWWRPWWSSSCSWEATATAAAGEAGEAGRRGRRGARERDRRAARRHPRQHP